MDRRRVTPRPQRGTPPVDLDDVIYGIHAVDEALIAGERLRRIHIGEERKNDPALRNVLEHARSAGIALRFENRSFFAAFPYKAHQSVVAFGASFAYLTLEEAIARRPQSEPGLWLILDHVTDPHNVGAIIRTAECVGVTAIVLPERRAAGINATVRKAAAGAVAFVAIAQVANVAQSVRAMKKAGIWIAGAALTPTAVSYGQADFNRDLAIVIGAEGAGISTLVARECDYLVSIPMRGKIASLNASVAAGILLYEVVRQRANARS